MTALAVASALWAGIITGPAVVAAVEHRRAERADCEATVAWLRRVRQAPATRPVYVGRSWVGVAR